MTVTQWRGDRQAMTVHFIGAGPGAADLITLRGRDLIARCPVCLYAGSIVPREILALLPRRARIVDTAPLSLDEIEAEFVAAHERGHDVARLQSGDLSVFSALGEQLRWLKRRGIPYTLTPGVPAFAAAAAAIELRTDRARDRAIVVLTRMPGRASAMPEGERLAASPRRAPRSRSILRSTRSVMSWKLKPSYGEDCPVAVVAEPAGPSERIVRGTLGDIVALAAEPIERTALILVGRALAAEDFRDSALYDADYRRRYRGEVPRERRGTATWPTSFADAVEHRDLDFDGDAGDNRGGGVPRGAGDFIAERHAFFGSMGEGLRRGVGGEDAFAERAPSRRPSRRDPRARRDRQTPAANGDRAGLRELGHLAEAAGHGHPRHRMRRADI